MNLLDCLSISFKFLTVHDLYTLLYIWLMPCLCYRLAARTKAALMLPKYGSTGTPHHPSYKQACVYNGCGYIQ